MSPQSISIGYLDATFKSHVLAYDIVMKLFIENTFYFYFISLIDVTTLKMV